MCLIYWSLIFTAKECHVSIIGPNRTFADDVGLLGMELRYDSELWYDSWNSGMIVGTLV